MKNYIVLDGDKIVSTFKTNDGREGITVSESEYNSIKGLAGKKYMLVNNLVVEEDNPDYVADEAPTVVLPDPLIAKVQELEARIAKLEKESWKK
jgi:hypothetical protein